ncbi:MAG: SRPBCC family protein [Actinomycetota bacterium]|nr:SRPBCC family protein [Actinomycetota bacterium]
MFKRTKSQVLKDNAASATDFATALAKDKKFRRELLSAISHGRIAGRRASSRIGFVAATTRLATDPKLKNELRKMTKSLEGAWGRVEKKRSHKLRNSILIIAGVGGAAAAALKTRGNGSLPSVPFTGGTSPRTIDESIEVNVPVSVAYNQWTQFEDFPLFMEGVEHVEQKDDTRLHWVAKIGGKTEEWDAKILEQHPDKQVSWISEDGKKTRGTVAFEPVGESRTRINLSMSYQAEGLTETLGSAVGLDQRRVRGDLQRFKELIESRGAESGAWRGEVAAGTKK